MLFNLLETPLFTHLICHPQCPLKPSEPRNGHVKAHCVHETNFRALRSRQHIFKKQIRSTDKFEAFKYSPLVSIAL